MVDFRAAGRRKRHSTSSAIASQPLLEDLNQQVIRTAIAEGHTDGSCGALDGTTVAANATRHRMVNLETVEKRLEILDREIAEAERSGDRGGRARRSRARGRGPTADDLAVLDVAESRRGAVVESRDAAGQEAAAGRMPPRPRGSPGEARGQRAASQGQTKGAAARSAWRLGDPTAPFGLDKLKTYRPLYNVQTMSDVQTDLVLAYATTRTTADSGQLLPMIERTEEMTGRPLKEVLVDSGYPSGEDLAWCEDPGRDRVRAVERELVHGGEASRKGGTGPDPQGSIHLRSLGPDYRCPEGKPLTYRERTTKQRANGDYFTIEIYQADPSDCAGCPLKARCVRGRSGGRTVRRQEHEELVEGLKSG